MPTISINMPNELYQQLAQAVESGKSGTQDFILQAIARYRYVADGDLVLILAIRSQRQTGYP